MNFLGRSEMFVTGIEQILEGDGFQIPSPIAAAARETATTLLAWCRNPANEQALSTFSSHLVSKLQVAVTQQARKLQTRREKTSVGNVPFHSLHAVMSFAL